MNRFEYVRAATPDSATAAVSGDAGARFLAGGTTLVDLLRLNVETPRTVVDINGVPLSTIDSGAGAGVRIGAMVRNSTLAADPRVRARYPVLAEALLAGANPQIRNMASVGGNLMQRTRCPYFRDTASACNKRMPGSGCAALGGYNRMHAVLGTSDRCIATHPSDMAVALLALDAVVRTRRPAGGERTIPLDVLYIAYGEDPARESVLAHGELITAVELPAVPWFTRSTYVKVRDRASFDFALASAAVALDLSQGRIRAARIALGGLATKPWRSVEAERALTGAPVGDASFRAAADAALADARAQRDNEFKIELGRRTIVRALTTAAAKSAA